MNLLYNAASDDDDSLYMMHNAQLKKKKNISVSIFTAGFSVIGNLRLI